MDRLVGPNVTHEERLILIYRPFHVVRHLTSYPHAGTLISDGRDATLANKIRGHGGAFEDNETMPTPVDDLVVVG